MDLVIGIMIPFLGTTLGAACVFLFRKEMKQGIQKGLLGFASGVMVAASVWSLLIPAIEMSQGMGHFAFIPATIGFALGIIFLLLMDHLIPHLHREKDIQEGIRCRVNKTVMLFLAVTLHNIPEGMAVGIGFAGAQAGNTSITMLDAIVLAIGIAIQNIPEGAIISLPIKGEGRKKSYAFLYGTFSGVVEPIAAVITLLLSEWIASILPVLLAFAAGAMMYVVVEELIPEGAEKPHSDIPVIGFAVGFLIMMILDVSLG